MSVRTKANLSAISSLLLCTMALGSAPGLAQDTVVPADADSDGDNTIVVIGQRLSGQVLTDAAPIAELDEADISALGAGSIAEVVSRLGSQTESASGRGGRPVFLVNGRRISSFREMRSYPPEALKKVEILPEEVALQYGFPADRRVVNFILKDDFKSREVEFEYEQPAQGGFHRTEIEGTYLRIAGQNRFNVNLERSASTSLTEAGRGLNLGETVFADDPNPALYRTLLPKSESYEATANWSRGLGQGGAGGSLSVNATYEGEKRESLDGLTIARLTDPDDVTLVRSINPDFPLQTVRKTDSFALGSTLNSRVAGWQITATLDGNLGKSVTDTDRSSDVSALTTDALAGLFPINGPLPDLAPGRTIQARSNTITLDSLLTANRTVIDLPAGEVTLSLNGGYRWNRIKSRDDSGSTDPTRFSRSRISGGFNLGVPLTSERRDFLGALGELSISLGAGIDDLSDFGTLINTNLGLNWRPVRRLTLSANFKTSESAPSLTRLGAPTVVTPNVPVFDFASGEAALVTITTGGNPDLLAESQSDWKLSASYDLDWFEDADISVEYFDETSDDVTVDFPILIPAIEAAFSERVTRDADGNLLAIDQRPVTFDSRSARRLRTSLNMSGNIGKEPERGEGGRREGASGRGQSATPSFGRRGGNDQGRWRVGLDYTYQLKDEVVIRPGGPTLDLLDGDALGNGGGLSRHTVSLDNFAIYKGIGGIARLQYSSKSRIDGSGLPGSTDLFFGSLARLNLRTFANLETLLPTQPALKGMRLSLFMNNVFDARQTVLDGDGDIPRRYLPDALDPTGRYVGVDVRKIF